MDPMQPAPYRPNSLAIWSFVLGLVGFAVSGSSVASGSFALDLYYQPVSGLLVIVTPILAVIFGHIGLARAQRGARAKGIAIAGLVLGYLLVATVVPRLVVSFSAAVPGQ
jgi:hypothetical protein